MVKRKRAREAKKLQQKVAAVAAEKKFPDVAELFLPIDTPEKAAELGEAIMDPRRTSVIVLHGVPLPGEETTHRPLPTERWERQLTNPKGYLFNVYEEIKDGRLAMYRVSGAAAQQALAEKIFPFRLYPHSVRVFPAHAGWREDQLQLRSSLHADGVIKAADAVVYDIQMGLQELDRQEAAVAAPQYEQPVVSAQRFEGTVATVVNSTQAYLSRRGGGLNMVLVDLPTLLPKLRLHMDDVFAKGFSVSGTYIPADRTVTTIDHLRTVAQMVAELWEHSRDCVVVRGRLLNCPLLDESLLTGPLFRTPGAIDPTKHEGLAVEVLPGVVLPLEGDADAAAGGVVMVTLTQQEQAPDYPAVFLPRRTPGTPQPPEGFLVAAWTPPGEVGGDEDYTLSFLPGGPSWLTSVEDAALRATTTGTNGSPGAASAGHGLARPTESDSAPADTAAPTPAAVASRAPEDSGDAAINAEDVGDVEDPAAQEAAVGVMDAAAVLIDEPHDALDVIEEAVSRLREHVDVLHDQADEYEKMLRQTLDRSRTTSSMEQSLQTATRRAHRAEQQVSDLQHKVTAREKQAATLKARIAELRQENDELTSLLQEVTDADPETIAQILHPEKSKQKPKEPKPKEHKSAHDRSVFTVEVRGNEFSDPTAQLHWEMELFYMSTYTEEERARFPLNESSFSSTFFKSLDVVKEIPRHQFLLRLVDIATGRSRSVDFRFVDKDFALRGAKPTVRSTDRALQRRAYLQEGTAGARRLHYWLLPDKKTVEFHECLTHE
ncbi:hypothetical protein C1Y63_09865 [Corynebacterium sp. 13CS0277]|uniref:hypothetical protein n=1 Tax=Corynebacterium sp. 13CS0277 TaxID=2071994 RepID=UPI000D03BDD3|nr:hypothetical protein [Corynebacterium sp. 13CS0277]PRQ10754.1 hypothetical protein C1Y63_09865 [Corynebacterium sp. 13CS0277]